MQAVESKLLAHVDTTYKSRHELAFMDTPKGTRSWKPIPHYELVESISAELDRRDIAIVREQFAVGGRDNARLFGVLDLRARGRDRSDIGMAMGIRGANDKSMRLSIVTGSRVFVCDNMAFSGSEGSILLSRKHTSRLDLSKVVPQALDTYLVKSLEFEGMIERMEHTGLLDDEAKGLIYDAFLRAGVMALRYMPQVHKLYFDDDEQREKFAARNLWALNNAFTEAVKVLDPAPQERAGLAIGRFFGQLCGPQPQPAAVAVAAERVIEPAYRELVEVVWCPSCRDQVAALEPSSGVCRACTEAGLDRMPFA